MFRTYHIFTYGFTAIEENIIGKMLPDKKSVLVSTDCFTDLVACSSYAILIHAASVAQEEKKRIQKLNELQAEMERYVVPKRERPSKECRIFPINIKIIKRAVFKMPIIF